MKKEEKGLLKLIYFVYKTYYKGSKFVWHIYTYVVLKFLIQVYPLLTSFLLANLIDKSIEAMSNGDSVDVVFPYIIYLAVASIFSTVFYNLFQYVDSVVDLWIPYLDDEVYLNKYLQIEPKAYEDPKFINQKEMLSWNGWNVPSSFYQAVDCLALIPMLILSFLGVYSQVPLLSLLAVLSSIPSSLVIIKFGRKVWSIWGDKGEEKIKYSSYRSVLWGSKFEHLQEVYVFRYGKYLLDKAKDINKKFILRLSKTYSKRYTWSGLASFFSNLISIFVLVLSIKFVFDGNLTIGMLTFLISAYRTFSDNFADLLYKISTAYGNKNILQTFYNVINWKNSLVQGDKNMDDVCDGLSVEFRNVWFKYPDTKRWILKNVSFGVDIDEDIALVGKNGAGKTTIIKLILRIYDPQKGDIFINGINIKELDLTSYYQLVGILSQSFNHLGVTAEDNILVGDVTKKESVVEASKKADFHEVVKDLPLGYKTFLSREIKDGIQLSGGQWQKLAIARAFYRDAKLLILDEPTSAVDSISEERIFENIRKNAKSRTTIIVSHRFATVRKAKRIIVIDGGRVVEDGQHVGLMENKGLYYEMYSKQVG